MNNERLISISPDKLDNWKGHDREIYELNTEDAIASLRQGQTTPILVRPCDDEKMKMRGVEYEVIDGERRLHAAREIFKENPEFKLKAVVKVLSDEEAYVEQLIANVHSPLCGFSNANSYKNTMLANDWDRVKLAKRLNIAKSSMTRRLNYLDKKLDPIWTHIKDKSKISENLVSKMVVLLNKAKDKESLEEYQSKLIAIASDIELGNANRLVDELLKEFEDDKLSKGSRVHNNKGDFLYTINPKGEIKLSKKVSKMIDMEDFNKQLCEIIDSLVELSASPKRNSDLHHVEEFETA